MLPFIIIGGLVALGIGIAASSGNDKDEVTVTKESDCSEEFLLFNEGVSISSTRRRQLIAARKALQKKIKEYFSTKTDTPTPTFYIQGSYKHGTIIRKQDNTCDVDVGVYFPKKPIIAPLTIHKNIVSAFEGHTKEEPTIKDKCVRIYYSNQFHIDLPVYYNEGDQYYIGIGSLKNWRQDDPRLFTNWLKEKTTDNPQIIRVIKYFKAWADMVKTRLGQKMPSGLALTIWGVNYYEKDAREDLAFFRTAIKIYSVLNNTGVSNWDCKMPTAPEDDVIIKLNEEQRNNFLTALKTLIEDTTRIVQSSSKNECLQSWKSIFGRWF